MIRAHRIGAPVWYQRAVVRASGTVTVERSRLTPEQASALRIGIENGTIDPNTGLPYPGLAGPDSATLHAQFSQDLVQLSGDTSGGSKSASSGGGSIFSGLDVSKIVSAIGTSGIGAVDAGLAQMSRDELLQAQRDAQALASSQGGTPDPNTQTLIALLAQRTRSLGQPSQQQGMSTTTIVVVGGILLAAVFMFTRKR